MPVVISFIGKSSSGKTTLLEKLIPVLTRRGYRIGTIKHTHHAFEADQESKDSWRHKKAGAGTVIIAADDRIAMVRDTADGADPDRLLPYFPDADLIITEGYKQKKKPKIEVIRAARSRESVCRGDETLVAVATDTDIDLGVPRFSLEDVEGLADFIVKRFL